VEGLRTSEFAASCNTGGGLGASPLWAAWKCLPHEYVLPQDEVQIWRARIDWPTKYIARLQQTLSPDELERADKFYFRRIGRDMSLAGACRESCSVIA
jgi:hypothetical protein